MMGRQSLARRRTHLDCAFKTVWLAWAEMVEKERVTANRAVGSRKAEQLKRARKIPGRQADDATVHLCLASSRRCARGRGPRFDARLRLFVPGPRPVGARPSKLAPVR